MFEEALVFRGGGRVFSAWEWRMGRNGRSLPAETCIWLGILFNCPYVYVYSPFSLSAKPTQIIDVLVCSGGHTGEGAGGGCAPSRAKHKAKNAYYSEVSQIGP